jgi:hypothetical protein
MVLLAHSRHALLAEAVAELGFGTVTDVDVHRPPSALVAAERR